MSSNFISKHIRFTKTHVDILDKLIRKKEGINNYSEAVRYAITLLDNPLDEDQIDRKINSIGKDIDIIKEMIAGGFHENGIKAIGKAEDTYIYQDAKRNVESKIQRSTTIKSNFKQSNVMSNNSISEELKEIPKEIPTEKPKAFNWPI
ncbi:hypothetical protein AB9M62_25550 [Bacillales bacterium AN1005]